MRFWYAPAHTYPSSIRRNAPRTHTVTPPASSPSPATADAGCRVCYAAAGAATRPGLPRDRGCHATGAATRPPGLLRGCRACYAAAGAATRLPGLLQALDDVVDAGGQRLHVGRVHRGEHADPQLVAAQLAVRLRVHDPVRPQHRRERRGVHLVIEVDRPHDLGALLRPGHERRRVRGL